MKNKKGFTLIELLAVILILGIIALIAIPTVNKILEESRKGAFKSTIGNMINAVEKDCMLKVIKEESISIIYKIENNKITPNVDIKGDLPNEGVIIVDKECKVVSLNAKNNNHFITKDSKNDVLNFVDYANVFPNYYTGVYDVVDTVYFNPNIGEKCNKEDAISTHLTTNGCMKWYAIENSDSTKATVDVILDHNNGANVAYNSSGPATSMGQIGTTLNSATASWVFGLNPRLITSDEIAYIVAHPTFKNETSTYNDSFIFENSKRYIYGEPELLLPKGTAKYKWLLNYINDCEKYGCDVQNISTYGYWTSSVRSDSANNQVWTSENQGLFFAGRLVNGYYGLRTVITVPKDKLK